MRQPPTDRLDDAVVTILSTLPLPPFTAQGHRATRVEPLVYFDSRSLTLLHVNFGRLLVLKALAVY